MAAAPRAPAVAAHWFEVALRLLPAEDRERQVDVRVDLARTLRSLGELERCRETLLEALALLPADALARRVDLTARCAAIEHWLGRHEEAHARLARAWDELPDRSTPAAAALQLELTVDGLYELDFEQTISMGHGALVASRATGDRALIAAAASALALGEAAAGRIDAAREHREEATALVDRLSDAELAPRLETLYYLGWAENYLEHYDDAAAHADRGVAIARSTGEGRLLVPIGLVKGYTYEMQGRVAEAIELCETAVEATRLSAGTHELSWALCELAFARYHAGHLESAIAAAEESARVGGRLAGDTMPAGGGGPGWVLAMSLFEAGEVERGAEIMHSLGSDDLPHKIPVEKCFDWEVLALVELARGRNEAAEGYVRRTRGARRAARPAPAGGPRPPGAGGRPARRRRAAGRGPARAAGGGGRRRRRRAAAGRLLARARRPRARRRRRARGGDRGPAAGRERARRVRRGPRTRRDAPRAAPTGCARPSLHGRRGRRAGVSPSCSASCAACGAKRCRRRWAGHSATLTWSWCTRPPTGRCRRPTTGGPSRPVERDGRQFAALVYDASLDDDPELVEAVAAAAAIALENELLQLESQARLAELQASRERIVAAGDAERRRLERNLHDGAQQRLVALAMQLRLIQADIRRDPSSAEAMITSAGDELAQSLGELRELARGLHPAVLEHGLASALNSLAARSTVPTAVTCEVTERLPQPIALAMYFVACEALANVAKYAQATAASVSVARTDGGVAIEIADDGVGGADASARFRAARPRGPGRGARRSPARHEPGRGGDRRHRGPARAGRRARPAREPSSPRTCPCRTTSEARKRTGRPDR